MLAWCHHRVGGIGQQAAGQHVDGTHVQYLGGTKRRKRHCPRPRRTLPHRSVQFTEGELAYLIVVTASGGRSQSPDASSPAVVERRLVFPNASLVQSISALALRVQSLLKKSEAQP